VKKPVDSTTKSTPMSPHLRLAGSRSAVERMVLPLTYRFDDFDVGVVLGGAEDQAADASESVDTDLDRHGDVLSVGGVGMGAGGLNAFPSNRG